MQQEVLLFSAPRPEDSPPHPTPPPSYISQDVPLWVARTPGRKPACVVSHIMSLRCTQKYLAPVVGSVATPKEINPSAPTIAKLDEFRAIHYAHWAVHLESSARHENMNGSKEEPIYGKVTQKRQLFDHYANGGSRRRQASKTSSPSVLKTDINSTYAPLTTLSRVRLKRNLRLAASSFSTLRGAQHHPVSQPPNRNSNGFRTTDTTLNKESRRL